MATTTAHRASDAPDTGSDAADTGSDAADSDAATAAATAALCAALSAGDGRGALALLARPTTIVPRYVVPEMQATPLHVACGSVTHGKQLAELLPKLRTAGSRVLARQRDQTEVGLPVLTAMHVAVGAGNGAAARLLAGMHRPLLDSGLDTLSPLHYAVVREQPAMLVLLLRLGATSGTDAALRWLIATNRAEELRVVLRACPRALAVLKSMDDALYVAAAGGAWDSCSFLSTTPAAYAWRRRPGSGMDYERNTGHDAGCPRTCFGAAVDHLGRRTNARRAYTRWRRDATVHRFQTDDALPDTWTMRAPGAPPGASTQWYCSFEGADYVKTIHALARAAAQSNRRMRDQRHMLWVLSKALDAHGGIVHESRVPDLFLKFLGYVRPLTEDARWALMAEEPGFVKPLDRAVKASRFDEARALVQHGASPYTTAVPAAKGREWSRYLHKKDPAWCQKCAGLGACLSNAVHDRARHMQCLCRLLMGALPAQLDWAVTCTERADQAVKRPAQARAGPEVVRTYKHPRRCLLFLPDSDDDEGDAAGGGKVPEEDADGGGGGGGGGGGQDWPGTGVVETEGPVQPRFAAAAQARVPQAADLTPLLFLPMRARVAQTTDTRATPLNFAIRMRRRQDVKDGASECARRLVAAKARVDVDQMCACADDAGLLGVMARANDCASVTDALHAGLRTYTPAAIANLVAAKACVSGSVPDHVAAKWPPSEELLLGGAYSPLTYARDWGNQPLVQALLKAKAHY
jgi:hypothetical protein